MRRVYFEKEKTMKERGLLSIGELANFARVSRTALLHYDHLGLVRPVGRGKNSYRRYSYHQIASTNLIITLQELGIPLKVIMSHIRSRTPQSIINLFAEQSAKINESIANLQRAQKLLLALKEIIEEGLSADERKIELHWAEEESILLGPQIDYSKGKTIEEATLDFYKYWHTADPNLDLNYPVWAIYSKERLKRGDWVGPDQFYFKMPGASDRKPAGLYLTGYTRGSYGQSDALYKMLMTYIEDHGLEICGPAYETYPLNELSIENPDNYLMRISISVRELGRSSAERTAQS